jgi:hypothetical protein
VPSWAKTKSTGTVTISPLAASTPLRFDRIFSDIVFK